MTYNNRKPLKPPHPNMDPPCTCHLCNLYHIATSHTPTYEEIFPPPKKEPKEP